MCKAYKISTVYEIINNNTKQSMGYFSSFTKANIKYHELGDNFKIIDHSSIYIPKTNEYIINIGGEMIVIQNA